MCLSATCFLLVESFLHHCINLVLSKFSVLFLVLISPSLDKALFAAILGIVSVRPASNQVTVMAKFALALFSVVSVLDLSLIHI